MSYKQIFRRAKRIVTSKLDDASEKIFSEKKDMHDFDEELKRSQQHKADDGQRASSSKQQSSSRNQHEGGGHRSNQQQQSRKKAGEKSDAEYLAILGLPQGATNEQLREAYKKMISQYHPDRVANLGKELQELATKKTKDINEAYQTLKKRRGMN